MDTAGVPSALNGPSQRPLEGLTVGQCPHAHTSGPMTAVNCLFIPQWPILTDPLSLSIFMGGHCQVPCAARCFNVLMTVGDITTPDVLRLPSSSYQKIVDFMSGRASYLYFFFGVPLVPGVFFYLFWTLFLFLSIFNFFVLAFSCSFRLLQCE